MSVRRDQRHEASKQADFGLERAPVRGLLASLYGKHERSVDVALLHKRTDFTKQSTAVCVGPRQECVEGNKAKCKALSRRGGV